MTMSILHKLDYKEKCHYVKKCLTKISKRHNISVNELCDAIGINRKIYYTRIDKLKFEHVGRLCDYVISKNQEMIMINEKLKSTKPEPSDFDVFLNKISDEAERGKNLFSDLINFLIRNAIRKKTLSELAKAHVKTIETWKKEDNPLNKASGKLSMAKAVFLSNIFSDERTTPVVEAFLNELDR